MRRMIHVLIVLILFSIGVTLMMLPALSSSDKGYTENQKDSSKKPDKVTEDKNQMPQDFASLWGELDKYWRNGLPKSALQTIEKIYQLAKEKKHPGYLVKSLILKMRFTQQVEEDAFVKIQKSFLQELEESEFPVTPLLYSMLAEQYWSYYQSNRHRFLNRTATSEEFKNEDIETWDLKKIVDTVSNFYEKSLENPGKLQATPVDLFDEVLYKGETGRPFRPTLYDFLAHRAVDFYMNEEAGLTKPKYEFTLDNEDFFLEADDFVKLELAAPDKQSFEFHALRCLQDLVKFHTRDKDPSALIDVDLKRLKWLNDKAVVSNKELLYEKVLLKMIEKYQSVPAVMDIYFELGVLYDGMADKYKPGISEDSRWSRKKAHDMLTAAVEKFPKAMGTRRCRDLISRIEAIDIQLTVEHTAVPGKPFRGLLRFKNTDQVNLRIEKVPRIDLPNADNSDHCNWVYSETPISFLLDKPLVKTWKVILPKEKDYQAHSTEIKFDSLPVGNYVIRASDGIRYGKIPSFVAVSNIAYITRYQDTQKLELYLVNRESGHPLKDAWVQVWLHRYDQKNQKNIKEKGKKFSTDVNGYLVISYDALINDGSNPTSVDFSLEFIKGGDHLMADQSFRLGPSYKSPTKNIRTVFFIDRAIYRPGQTVYFKGIVLETDSLDGKTNKILPYYSSTVTLYDVNDQKVSELDLLSNEYGTFNGTFTLPVGVLTGNMRITNNTGSVSFSMEEYKRPKFRVEFKPLEKSPRLNHRIEVKGEAKAFAGFGIDNAEVKYRVVRKVFYPYSWYWDGYCGWGYQPSQTLEMEILSGITQTDASGVFTVSFDAVPDLTLAKETRPAFKYTIYADVTDINGETRSAEKNVSIGYTNLVLSKSLPPDIDLDEGKQTISINSTNLSGEFVKARGTLSIHKLKDPKRVLRSKLWSKPDRFIIAEKEYHSAFPYDVYNNEDNPAAWEKEKTVFNSPFDTGAIKTLTISNLAQWKPGKYRVEMESRDENGNKIQDIKYITIFSSMSKRVPFKQTAWFAATKSVVEPGNKAVFLIGSSEKAVRVMVEVEYLGKIVARNFITLDNEQKRIEFPVREEHRGNVGVYFSFIRRSRLLHQHFNIIVPWSNKKLEITFGTFRNKLMAGEKEQWQIKIKGPQGAQVAAEMAAALYDASLDEFRPHSWWFDVFPFRDICKYWQIGPLFNVSNSYWTDQRFMSRYLPDYKEYDRLAWFEYNISRHYYYVDGAPSMGIPGGVQGGLVLGGPPDEVTVAGKSSFMELATTTLGGNAAADKKSPEKTPSDVETPIQVRKNFNETAFFYPQLYSSPGGEITISFTIPEALTKWKMLGFAHTKNLEYGLITNELVTQKDLMIIPNPPRFFREGDTLVFTAKITNLADQEISGTAKLLLFDAVSMNPVDGMFKNHELEKPFKVAKGQSALVSWEIHIPDGEDLDAVTYRLTAAAEKFSDGEEQTLPILKNRMLVTETLPLPVRALQTKTFSFDKLVQSSRATTLKHHKLTLEFTGNPVWYAIQALPYLMEYPYECMEQVFSRYYANSVASYIVNSNPKIKRVFDLWKSGLGQKESPNANALLSNLEKNQELKSLLLQETPWVQDGKNETERKKRVALLFDLNLMAQQLGSALKKMKDGQMASGAWPWFNGMQESQYITQYIVTGFAHLRQLKVIDARSDYRIWDMIRKAIQYLDNETREDYERLIRDKRDLSTNHLGYIHAHYLYARSNFQDIEMAKRNVKAFEYYKDQAKKYWTGYSGNKYIQGMIALIMKRYNDMETAKAIAASLKEHALYSDEMGMYWKNGLGYYWYQAPIETQALLIEVFDEVLNDQKSINDMKTWLLKQKQTQDWGNTKATVNACCALLMKGDDWLKESKAPQITLGKEHPLVLEPGKPGPDDELIKAEAGTGYFKVSWHGKEILPEMGNVTVRNNNNVVAWGGLYWQYFENLDKITSAETPLKLTKKLFVEKPSDTGPVLHPLEGTVGLKVGDRVKVRIEIRVDRNLEYVHMKDLRASAFEPEDVISMYKRQDGLGYYQSTKDASANFFFDYLPKGTYVFEYALRVTHSGEFSNGITSIQCMYAPEFTAHSEGIRVKID